MSEPTAGNPSHGIPDPEIGATGFAVAATWHGTVLILAASGTLDMATAPQFTESIEDSLTNEPAVVIIDLTDVEFLASAGMTVLLTVHERIRESAQFAVVADGPSVARPMHLVGLDKLLTIHTTLDAALEAATVT
ncbi:STAS domain-containing protein [Aldersonia kunmingensis]|uniref:STAS domain-containing protein n=1 Tax=Aldersonia kunmingensis TaxID=408066 RepID=UPI000ADF633B|nr:STAS domain-containing protein [Aldersonia kunmingensis]